MKYFVMVLDKRENEDREEGSKSRPWDMSIPLKLFLGISHERKSVFRDVRIKANIDQCRSDVSSELNKMAASLEISFVDENNFVKEGKLYFLSENSQWEISSILFRLKLKTI